MSVQQRLSVSLRTVGGTIGADMVQEASGTPTVDTAIPNGSFRLDVPIGSYVASKLISVFLVSSQAVTLRCGGVDAVQTLSASGPPTAGTFTLTFGGNTTAGIAWNATASAVESALGALASITGSVSCAGGPLPGTPVVITFKNALAQGPRATITSSSAGLTGGTVAVASTVTGTNPDQTFAVAAGLATNWQPGMLTANPLTVNCSRWTVENTSGFSAQFQAYLGTSL